MKLKNNDIVILEIKCIVNVKNIDFGLKLNEHQSEITNLFFDKEFPFLELIFETCHEF